VMEAWWEKRGSVAADFKVEVLLCNPTKKLLILVPKSDISPPVDSEISACVIYFALNISFAKPMMAPSWSS
jgi:hypothetical protein